MTALVTWRMVALIALVLLAGKFAAGVVHDREDGQRMTAAANTLALVRDSARAGIAAAQSYRQAVDSMADVIAHLPRPSKTRQRTEPVLVDACDTLAVVALVATLTAERDTARADVALLSTSLDRAQELADSMRVAARLHAAADSARYASIDTRTTTVIAVIRPRWYKRLASGLVRTGKVAGVAAVAFAIGRAT